MSKACKEFARDTSSVSRSVGYRDNSSNPQEAEGLPAGSIIHFPATSEPSDQNRKTEQQAGIRICVICLRGIVVAAILIRPTFSVSTPLFLLVSKECAMPQSNDSFRRGGAHIPTRGRNNAATTTISFLNCNRAILTKGASCLRSLPEAPKSIFSNLKLRRIRQLLHRTRES
jgi:hypothetical protein